MAGSANTGRTVVAARLKTFPSRVDEDLVEDKWSRVRSALHKILQNDCSGLSFDETYRNAYAMVLLKRGGRLYDGVRETVLGHLVTVVWPNVLDSADGGHFLRTLDRCWTDHRTAMARIRDMLVFADKANAKRGYAAEVGVYDLGLVLFRDAIALRDRTRDRLRDTLLRMVADERDGRAIDRVALRDACRMLVALGVGTRAVYHVDFEVPFLERSGRFYEAEARRLLAENDAIAYARKAASRIDEEAERARECLDVSTVCRIVRVVERELVANHAETIVGMENSGAVHMLKNGRIQDLHFMYKLLSRCPAGVEIMSACLSRCVREECQVLVKRDDTDLNPVAYVQSLLDFNDKLEYLARNFFANDRTFKEATSGFYHFLIFNPKLPRYVSLYIDDKLWIGNRGLGDSGLEVALDKAMVLFRHLQDKDVFETYYRQHLAKRLLFSKSVSEDNEKDVISRLKTECGCQYTSRLEGMFKDVSLSNTTMKSYELYKKPSSAVDAMDLTVRVLTTRFWPWPAVTPRCALPKQTRVAYEEFRTYYLDTHGGRKLRLQPQLGLADISAIFYVVHRDNNAASTVVPDVSAAGPTSDSGPADRGNSTSVRRHLFQVSTYQMAILMLFNSFEKMTMQMIMNETNINEKDLTRELRSLAVGKSSQKILLKSPKTKQIEPHHEFSVNESFSSRFYRTRIRSITTIGEDEVDRLSIWANVNEDRKREIEAVVLRVMKMRKRLTHTALTMEVTEQLRSKFMPSPVVVKKRIECLIEQKRLVRSDLNRFMYTFPEEQVFAVPDGNIRKFPYDNQLWNSKEVVYGA